MFKLVTFNWSLLHAWWSQQSSMRWSIQVLQALIQQLEMPTHMRQSYQKREKSWQTLIGIFFVIQFSTMCTFSLIKAAFSILILSQQFKLNNKASNNHQLKADRLLSRTLNISDAMLSFSPISASKRKVSSMWTSSSLPAPLSPSQDGILEWVLYILRSLKWWLECLYSLSRDYINN